MRRTGEEIERTIEDIKKDLINGKSIIEILEKYNLEYYRLELYAEFFKDMKFTKKRRCKSVREIRNKLKS